MKRTLTNLTMAAYVAQGVVACMSDEKCGAGHCCYMNRCLPEESTECSGARMEIFKALDQAQMRTEDDVRTVVGQLRNDFDVRDCDAQGDDCIDYIGLMAEQLAARPEQYSINLIGQ